MAMTMTQKILAKHAGLESVRSGQLIEAELDMILGNDITSPVAINEFKKFLIEIKFPLCQIILHQIRILRQQSNAKWLENL